MDNSLNTQRVNILITAIGGGGNGDQILKALRLLTEDKYRLFGTDSNSNIPQKQFVDNFSVMPLASSSNYLDSLISFCESNEIEVLIPGSEAELKKLSANRSLLDKVGVLLLVNDAEVISLCMDKEISNARIFELGFKSPRYKRMYSKDEIELIDYFPLVVKPATGGGGSKDVFIVQNANELGAICDYLSLGEQTESIFVQEYVGDSQSEFTVGVLHDLDGKFVNSIALNRHLSGGLSVRSSVENRTGNPKFGNNLVISSGISQGTIDDFKDVTQQCTEIAEALGSKGPLNFQCRLVDGIVYVFEINPRFSGTSYMRAMLGFNEVDLLVRKHILGEEIPRNFEYEKGTIMRSLLENLIEH